MSLPIAWFRRDANLITIPVLFVAPQIPRYYRANSVRQNTQPCEGVCALNHYCAITRVDYHEFRQCLETAASALSSNAQTSQLRSFAGVVLHVLLPVLVTMSGLWQSGLRLSHRSRQSGAVSSTRLSSRFNHFCTKPIAKRILERICFCSPILLLVVLSVIQYLKPCYWHLAGDNVRWRVAAQDFQGAEVVVFSMFLASCWTCYCYRYCVRGLFLSSCQGVVVEEVHLGGNVDGLIKKQEQLGLARVSSVLRNWINGPT